MKFDPYRVWLGIPPHARPITFYKLLGIPPFEFSDERIEEVAAQRTALVRKHVAGPHAEQAKRILNELARARACLLDRAKRKQYDATLSQRAEGPAATSDDLTPPATGADTCKPTSPVKSDSRAAPAAPQPANRKPVQPVTQPDAGAFLNTLQPADASRTDAAGTWAFEPDLPSAARRQPARARSMVGWLGGVGLLAVCGIVAAMAVVYWGDVPIAGPSAHREPPAPVDPGLPEAEMDHDSGGVVPTAESPSQPANSASPTVATNPKQGTPEPVPAPPQWRPEQVLEGSLQQSRTLSAAQSPFALKGTVTVPSGSTLVVDEGVEIVAEPDSALVVRGRILTSGTPESPVRFRSDRSGAGRWKGIRLEGNECEGKLRGVVIMHAQSAMTWTSTRSTDETQIELDSCLLTDNNVGLQLDKFSGIRVTNTGVVRNRSDGVSAREDDGLYVRVTLAANTGQGYVCTGKPAATFEDCSVVGNQKGGIHCGTGGETFRPRWTANKCNLFSNEPFELFCEHEGGLLVNGNYWGAVFTRELMSLGDNEKRKPRSHIWDGLHPKYQKFGIILLSGTSLQPVETAGADAKVLAMAGGEPIDIKKFDGRNKPKAAPDTEPVELPELPAQFAGIAEQLRELLPARRYDEAAGVLEKALADPDLKQVSELIRGAQEDVRLLRGFWTLAADKMAGLKPGDSVLVGGMRGDLVEYRDGQVIATVGTVNRRTAFHDLRPRDLVFLFTDSNEPTDPDLLKKIWLFMATDRQGQPADVDHWRGLATRAGAELTGRGVYLIPKGKAR